MCCSFNNSCIFHLPLRTNLLEFEFCASFSSLPSVGLVIKMQTNPTLWVAEENISHTSSQFRHTLINSCHLIFIRTKGPRMENTMLGEYASVKITYLTKLKIVKIKTWITIITLTPPFIDPFLTVDITGMMSAHYRHHPPITIVVTTLNHRNWNHHRHTTAPSVLSIEGHQSDNRIFISYLYISS